MSAAKINDGGPAFPLANAEALFFAQAAEDCANPNLDGAERTFHEARRAALGGMSLRDYFAAKALGGICAHHDTWGLQTAEIGPMAYDIADAMLKARAA